MDFSDITITTPEPEKPNKSKKSEKNDQKASANDPFAEDIDKKDTNNQNLNQQEYSSADATDFLIKGANIGSDILKKTKKRDLKEEEDVIYGVYDNRDKGLSVRLNDFLIDHSKVKLRDKSYFFHMLAVMVDAGIPLIQALKALAYRTENLKFKRVLNTIAYNCEHGSKFADAMSRFEDVFDEAEVGIVRSGEATGKLHVMLFRLSAELDKRHALTLKLWGAAIYPIAVLSVLVVVAVLMLVWVFPTLLNLLSEGGMGGENLPLPTRILIGLQYALLHFWWFIVIVVFGVYGMFKIYVGSDYGAVRWDYLKLKLPIIGTLLRRVYVLRFVSLLGLLIDSGLPMIKCIKITGESLANRLFKLKTQEVLDTVKVGGKISESLADSEFLFPSDINQMLRVGESSASLGKVAEKVAAQYEREIDTSLKKLSSIFEPVMILVVGAFVALLALAIMEPIMNLGSAVGT